MYLGRFWSSYIDEATAMFAKTENLPTFYTVYSWKLKLYNKLQQWKPTDNNSTVQDITIHSPSLPDQSTWSSAHTEVKSMWDVILMPTIHTYGQSFTFFKSFQLNDLPDLLRRNSSICPPTPSRSPRCTHIVRTYVPASHFTQKIPAMHSC